MSSRHILTCPCPVEAQGEGTVLKGFEPLISFPVQMWWKTTGVRVGRQEGMACLDLLRPQYTQLYQDKMFQAKALRCLKAPREASLLPPLPLPLHGPAQLGGPPGTAAIV